MEYLMANYQEMKQLEHNTSQVTYNKMISLGSQVSSPAACEYNVAAEYGAQVTENYLEMVPHQLPEGLRAELMPKHVGIVMDGNRRWAKHRDLPIIYGHSAGKKALKQLVRLCSRWGIKVLTVFAFSTENWSRPKEEVNDLMQLIEELVKSDLAELIEYGSRISVIGNRTMLPKSLQESIEKAEKTSKENLGTVLNLAINYGGRYDIVQACKTIAIKTKDGLLQPDDISDIIFHEELQTKCIDHEFQNPDLFIRTSGEQRISNFLLWQLAYTELYFVETLFPDFGEEEFIKALRSFQKRQRRYGGCKL